MNNSEYVITNLFQTSESILKGLIVLSDEAERRRYTDEYYLLIDKIDSIEDKLLELGGDLEQIYGNLQLLPNYPVIINTDEILLLAHIFNKDEYCEWLKCAIMATGITKPLDILLFLHSHYSIKARDNLLFLPCNAPGNLILTEDRKRFEWLLQENDVKAYEDKTKCLNITIPNKIFEKWLKELSLFMASKPLPSSEFLTRYNVLLAFFTGINAKTMVDNIRAIYCSLYAEYKKLKYAKRNLI